MQGEKNVSTELSDIRLQLTLWKDSVCGALHDLVPFVQFKKREKHS